MNNSLGIASLCRVIMRNACFLSRVSIPCFLHGDSMPSAPPLRARLPSGLAQKACPEGRRPPGQPKGTPKALPPWGRLGRCPGCALGCPGGALGHPQGTPKAPPGQFDNQRHESVTNSAVPQEGRRSLGVTTAGPRKRGPVEVEAPSTNSTTRDTNL